MEGCLFNKIRHAQSRKEKTILLRHIIHRLHDWLYTKFAAKYELDSNNFGKCTETE